MKKTETAIPNSLLRSQRKRRYWTQSHLAELVGTTNVNVNRWESGLTTPGLYFRQKLCELFGMSPEELGLVPIPNELSPSTTTSPLVFLASSYADAEKEGVLHLQSALQAREINLWSSRQVRRQGAENPREALYEAIRTASVVLLVLSPQARSSRHIQEALQMAKIYQRPICAVWIEGERWQECLPTGCGELHALIDARQSNDATLLSTLIETLEPLRLARTNTPAALDTLEPVLDELPEVHSEPGEPHEPRNPYKGLQAFRCEDQHDFFGRDSLIAELAAALEASMVAEQQSKQSARLLAVVGPSGSGKSSVVMAGLLPYLQAGGLPGSQEWVYLNPIVPGMHPLESLALALAERLPDKSLKTICEDLEDDSARGLHLLATSLVKQLPARVVLLVDQFEELFIPTTPEEERRRFIDLLVASMTEPLGPVIVILTLRADCYDRPLHYPHLGKLLEYHQRAVLPMEIHELRAAIERPARLPDVQLTFVENLVGDLLFEIQGQVGALPLLQFTLDQLFRRRSDHQLTFQAYAEMGGVKGALAKQAEETYAALPSDEHRRLARALFLRLIDPGTTEQDTTRRRAPLAELQLLDAKETVIIGEVVTAFIVARLLTADTIAGTPTVEVSHEALIREWPRLADWLRAAREDIHLQQAISKDAAAWEQRSKPGDRLYRGSQLVEARKWARRNTPSRQEVAFLQASVARRIRYVASVAVLFFLVVLLIVIPMRLQMRHLPPPIVSNLQDDGPGSLRQAVANASPGDTITFNASLRGIIVLSGADLNLSQNVSIRGPGAGVLAISRGNSIHGIRVFDRVSVTISGLTFKSEVLTSNSGIINYGTLTFTNCRFAGNGGLYNARSGTLTLTNDTIVGNAFSGVTNYGGLRLTNSTVLSNTALRRGGGIFNQGTVTVVNSTISGNRASSDGGGIANLKGGLLTLTGSTISDNTATGDGGGIFNDQDSTLTLVNSTLSGNMATGTGGGISIVGGQVDTTFCTIYGNKASQGGGVAVRDAPSKQSRVVIRTSIVAGNHADTGIGSDIAGRLTTGGYNLIQHFSGAIFVNPLGQHHTDLSGERLTDLKIEPVLRTNGGLTQTHALLPGSPAINRIPPEACHVNGISTDQRGMPRQNGQESNCDIGSYEYIDGY